jgi:Zn-dependent peptidase ImmA (M78 family)
MYKSLKSKVSESRRLFENPYAHIEHLEAPEDETNRSRTARLAPASSSLITASRKLLQDPYAYLDDAGGYSAVVNQDPGNTVPDHVSTTTYDLRQPSAIVISTPSRRYADHEIEGVVKDLHTRLWKDRNLLWDGVAPTDPIDILDPEVALRLYGYAFELEEGLGSYHRPSGHSEVAGLIDRTYKTVHVSQRFPPNVRLFTAAHELGHAALHPASGGIHRDRPIDGAALSRNPDEFQADKFATYFLMPANLVKTRFAGIFGTDCFSLSEETAFGLSGMSFAEIQAKCRTARDVSRLLASAERYQGRSFVSLAAQFRVSTEAMAIRLEELRLLAI